ncbi:MAG: DNA polymerase III [Treponema sp.]|nr:DNA polymerase III [Treponema sp.]
MFDNILYQSASKLLESDIRGAGLPPSLLFAGPAASGKLSAALETARILSCRAQGERGRWKCDCPSCLQHKALVSQNTLVAGPGDRTLEIRAAKATLLAQNAMNSSHLEAARYLYLRAVRKLTLRFSPILWEGDDKVSKAAPLLLSINEALENLTPGRTVPDADELQKLLDAVEKDCEKLESSFLYDSIPVSQIRNFSSWAHLKGVEGKKVLILENADRMADSARNALLKILEEPPENVVFILTTQKRNAMLPTILSRVRTYMFFERSASQQEEVIRRIFHYDPSLTHAAMPEGLNAFLQSYLDIKPALVMAAAASYFAEIAQGHFPDIAAVLASCGAFRPRVLLTIFLQGIIQAQAHFLQSPEGAACSVKILEQLRAVSDNISIFNQSPQAALEQLARNLMQIDHESGGVLRRLMESASVGAADVAVTE